jgi:hypothetical protein
MGRQSTNGCFGEKRPTAPPRCHAPCARCARSRRDGSPTCHSIRPTHRSAGVVMPSERHRERRARSHRRTCQSNHLGHTAECYGFDQVDGSAGEPGQLFAVVLLRLLSAEVAERRGPVRARPVIEAAHQHTERLAGGGIEIPAILVVQPGLDPVPLMCGMVRLATHLDDPAVKPGGYSVRHGC